MSGGALKKAEKDVKKGTQEESRENIEKLTKRVAVTSVVAESVVAEVASAMMPGSLLATAIVDTGAAFISLLGKRKKQKTDFERDNAEIRMKIQVDKLEKAPTTVEKIQQEIEILETKNDYHPKIVNKRIKQEQQQEQERENKERMQLQEQRIVDLKIEIRQEKEKMANERNVFELKLGESWRNCEKSIENMTKMREEHVAEREKMELQRKNECEEHNQQRKVFARNLKHVEQQNIKLKTAMKHQKENLEKMTKLRQNQDAKKKEKEFQREKECQEHNQERENFKRELRLEQEQNLILRNEIEHQKQNFENEIDKLRFRSFFGKIGSFAISQITLVEN